MVAFASLVEEQIDLGMKLPREAKIVCGIGVDLWLEPVAIYESIALPLETFQALVLWMKAFDKNNRLIRKDRMLGAF